MSERPAKLSVVIPCHNAEMHLECAIGSALGQTRPPDELIVVDDGSTDGSAAVAKRCPRVSYLYQEKRGPSAARNRGLAEASGRWVAFLDADDIWAPDVLESATDVFARDDSVEIVQGLILDVEKQDPCDNENGVSLEVLSGPYQFVNIGSMVFTRAVFEKVGGYDEALMANEDTDWLFRAWEMDCRKVVREKVALHYVIRRDSLASTQANPRSGLPALLKRHRDRRLQNTNGPKPSQSLAEFFGGFPDRSQRYPRGEYIRIPLN